MPEIPEGAYQPQDHLAPAREVVTLPFTFEVGEKTYTLPDADETQQARIPAHAVRSAADENNPLGEVKLMFATLDTCGADQETLKALYSLPFEEVNKIFVGWSQHKTTPEAASLGEYGDSPT